jgi:hypothetical protein
MAPDWGETQTHRTRKADVWHWVCRQVPAKGCCDPPGAKKGGACITWPPWLRQWTEKSGKMLVGAGSKVLTLLDFFASLPDGGFGLAWHGLVCR